MDTIRHSRILLTVVLLTATVLASDSSTQTSSVGPQLRYVANAGMLLTLEERKFLIDAPIREGIAPYCLAIQERSSS
jgi:hypothetical protein